MAKPIIFIAEIGVNHNGDLDLARKMIDAAKASDADYVKFQAYRTENLANQSTPKVDYQKNTTDTNESHFDMLKKLELNAKGHKELYGYCQEIGIGFISTPYDIESAKMLFDLNVDFFKTASADLVDLPLHEYIAQTGKSVLVSVGMATLDEIQDALSIYEKYPSGEVTLLHCVSNYPCADASLNLAVLNSFKEQFSCAVGYSDHSVDSFAATLSVPYGITVIEKHFTLDKTLEGPDHKASSTPEEFAKLVRDVRRAENVIGSSEKKCQEEEFGMAKVSRKSVTAAIDLVAGKIIMPEDLMMQRPGSGMKAKDMHLLIGKKLKVGLKKGDKPSLESVES